MRKRGVLSPAPIRLGQRENLCMLEMKECESGFLFSREKGNLIILVFPTSFLAYIRHWIRYIYIYQLRIDVWRIVTSEMYVICVFSLYTTQYQTFRTLGTIRRQTFPILLWIPSAHVWMVRRVGFVYFTSYHCGKSTFVCFIALNGSGYKRISRRQKCNCIKLCFR